MDSYQDPSSICPQELLSAPVAAIPTTNLTAMANSSPAAPQAAKKKRKSWGQVLPEPTTKLPPRKRAKTDEEKAQRKYERVQRNRAAAHNSRMRKQEELEKTTRERNQYKHAFESSQAECQMLRQKLAAFEKSFGVLSSQVQCPPTPPREDSPPALTNSPSESCYTYDCSMPTPATLPMEFDDSYHMKQFNDTHSAEMWSQQWTLNSQITSNHPLSRQKTLPLYPHPMNHPHHL